MQVITRGIDGQAQTTTTYTYDVNDRLIGKQVIAGGVTTTERYVYEEGQLALVFNASGQLQERYLYGPQTDQLLAVKRGATGPVQWLLGDDRGPSGT